MLNKVISVRVAMSDAKIERKIAVIFATDVVGYSKHMEADENETIHSLRACEEILQKLFAKYDGRLFNTGGDSFLAEFSSAVSAVECAVEFQKAIQTRNSSGGTNTKLEFRIGINSGDVVKEKDNLLGDGVNIAARLEALAQTNGITVSKVIYDFVNGKTQYEFNDLGLQKIKKNEFHAFDLLLNSSQKRKVKKNIPNPKALAVGLVVLFIALSASLYFLTINNAAIDQAVSTNSEGTPLSSSPVILVYPFKNLSASASGENLTTAITESMIASLSRYEGISVLSSSASSEAKSNDLSDTTIKDRYNAQFVVRGSIQTVSDKSRINLQLSDLSLKKVVWTDNISFSADEIFEVQDKIGDDILTHLQITAVAGSEVKSWAAKYGNAERLTLHLNARKEWAKFSVEGYENHTAIVSQLEQEMGENSPSLYNIKGWNLFLKKAAGLSKNPEQDNAELIRLSDMDVKENNDVTAYVLKALVEFRVGSKDCELSKAYGQKAIDLGATVDTFVVNGTIWVECGDLAAGTKHFENALRLQPNDSDWFLTRRLVPMYYRQGSIEKIINLVEPNLNAIDLASELLVFYSFAKLEAGEVDQAKAYFEKAKSKGVTAKSLRNLLREDESTKEFIARLKPLGSLD